MKWFFSVIAVALLGAGGWWGWQRWEAQRADNSAAKRIATAIVEARDIQFSITAAGDIGPADQVSVRPEINGRIAELPVDVGDQVKRDQLLCRLDDRDLQIERDQRLSEINGTRLEIVASQLQLAKAGRDFDRNRLLFDNNLIPKETLENFRTEFELAGNRIQQASNSLDRSQSALKLVEDRISKTKILAPFPCTILTRPVSLGQTVSGAAGFNSGTEVMTIANLNDMVINAHINQADVTRMKPGQTVEIQVESVPGLKMKGLVDRIAPQATIKNSIKGYAARIAMKELDPRVRPGMTAILNIPVATASGVASVPLSAVFTERGERYVYVKKGERFERRNVQVGLSDYSFAEVQKGLAGGDEVAMEMPSAELGGKASGGGPPKGAPDSPRPASGGTGGGGSGRRGG